MTSKARRRAGSARQGGGGERSWALARVRVPTLGLAVLVSALLVSGVLGCAGEVPEGPAESGTAEAGPRADAFAPVDAIGLSLDQGPSGGAGGAGGAVDWDAGTDAESAGGGNPGDQGSEPLPDGNPNFDAGAADLAPDPIDDAGLEADVGLPPDDEGDDGQPDAAVAPGPAPVDCAPLESRPARTVCQTTRTTCAGVFTDGVGCAAWCAAAGLVCAQVLENLDDQCAGDVARPPLRCDVPTGHNSDYCVCAAADCVSACPGGAGGAGAACGDDGCGGTCGGCDGDHVCESGRCAARPPGRPWEDLAGSAVGYGRRAIGGAGGEVCWVDRLDDAGPGTLRQCAERNGPTWVRFRISGSIVLQSMINVGSDKTVDGRGVSIEIRNRGLRLAGVRNVILHNLRLTEGSGDDQDALQIDQGAHNIWVDHVTFSRFTDGLIDITRGATDITVSWCLFREHDKVMLIGASVADVGDTEIRVTLHHNRFDGTNQRHPRLRYGRVHAFNNHFRRWGSYAVGISQRGQLRSERNIYEAGNSRSAVTTRVGEDPDRGLVRSVTEWRLNDAIIEQNARDSVFHPGSDYDFEVEAPDAALRDRIAAGAGWREVPLP